MTTETRRTYDLTDAEMNGHSVYSDLAAKTGVMNLGEWIEAHGAWMMPLDELKAALEADVAQVEAITVGDYYLYDSETNDMLSAEDIGITDAEYVAACAESMAAAPEGHIVVAGRRVYAAE